MINKEVIPVFDMLLEELERIIPDSNDQAKALMDQKKYDQAHALLNKAQRVSISRARWLPCGMNGSRCRCLQTKAPLPVPTSKPPKG